MKGLGLKGKRVLVTGAAGYLGQYICRELKLEGAEVIGTDVCAGPDILELDITNRAYVEGFASEIAPLYGVVNNAAVSFKGNDTSPADFMATMNVNIQGTFNCIAHLKSALESNASVVNVASIYGTKVPDFGIYEGNEELYNSSIYGASKAAILQLTRYYAVQLAPIRVNSVSPGGILQDHNAEFISAYSQRVPLKRMANPDEIVWGILSLLSPRASYITGHNLIVDGGMSA